MYDLIIIGAGPAGAAAGIYASSRDLKTLVIEKKYIGGLISRVSTVTHYPGIIEGESGIELGQRLKRQLESCHIDIVYEEVKETLLKDPIKTVKTNKGSYQAKTLIIAAGTEQNSLGAKGEDKFLGDFISHYAYRDGHKYRDGHILVVGGSDGALKEALYLAGLGKKVSVVHRGPEIAAIMDFQRIAKEKGNIEYILNSKIVEFDKEDKTNIVKIQNIENDQITEIKGENLGVFIFAGSSPQAQIYPGLDLEDGYIVTDRKAKTNIDGVYACGDIVAKEVRQVSTAVSEGTIAALEVKSYLS